MIQQSRSVVLLLLTGGLLIGTAFPQTPLGRDDAKKLKNPVPYSRKSIAEGKGRFIRDSCTGCHGPDGKAQVDAVADATDLTDPTVWRNGTSDGEIFRSIREGAGASMPAFKSQIPESAIWNLVNFIRNLWPESTRPALQPDPKPTSQNNERN